VSSVLFSLLGSMHHVNLRFLRRNVQVRWRENVDERDPTKLQIRSEF
jgi:hypothetical protein